jgi:hypothetical protein
MFSSYGSKTAPNFTTTADSIVVAVEQTDIVVAASSTSIELFGLNNALADLSNNFPRPHITATNAIITASTAGSMGTEITSLIVEGPETETKYTLAALGCNLALANGAQIYDYYQYHRGLQELQRRFLESILDLISKCYVETDSKLLHLKMPASLDEVMNFMYKNGQVTIQLKVPGTVFTLFDNSLTSTHVGGSVAAAVSLGVITCGLCIGYRLAGQMFERGSPEDVALRITSSVAPNIPFVHVINAMKKWRDKQERNILRAIYMVMNNVYLKHDQFHEMSLQLLSTLDYFVEEKDMRKNYAMLIQSIKDNPDVEQGTITKKLAAVQINDGRNASFPRLDM